MVHGFGEYSENYFELAYQFGLNGFDVHLFDIEGFGYSSGSRFRGPNIQSLHFQMTMLMNQFKEGVPTFLYGFSMGCMIINTYLLANPDLKVDAVIF
jgi:alpha-beta hydrolase superfamily lysophospholipase